MQHLCLQLQQKSRHDVELLDPDRVLRRTSCQDSGAERRGVQVAPLNVMPNAFALFEFFGRWTQMEVNVGQHSALLCVFP
jgi:hypothetical protein